MVLTIDDESQPPISSDRFDFLLREIGLNIRKERLATVVAILESKGIDDSFIDGYEYDGRREKLKEIEIQFRPGRKTIEESMALGLIGYLISD